MHERIEPEDEGLVQALLRGDANPTGVAQFLLRDDEAGAARIWWVAGELYQRGFMEGDTGEQTRSIEAVRDILREYVRYRPDLATRKLLERLSLSDDHKPAARESADPWTGLKAALRSSSRPGNPQRRLDADFDPSVEDVAAPAWDEMVRRGRRGSEKGITDLEDPAP
jgi:hypothetical protein